MDNYALDGQALVFKSDSAIEEFLSSDQPPSEYATNSCAVPSYVERLQNLMIADTHLFPLPSSVTAVGFACPIGHLPPTHGSLQSPTATGAVDCSLASSPGPCQSQWSEMSHSLTHETRASVAYLENQRQAQDLELFPVSHSITNIPQSLPQIDTLSASDAEQHHDDTWLRHFLGGTEETCSFSPHEHAVLSTSGSLRGVKDLSLTYETGAFVPYPQFQAQPGILCGWSPDLEPLPVPESAPMHTHSNSDAEQYDACTRYFLGGAMEICSSSPHEHTALSASGSLGGVRALSLTYETGAFVPYPQYQELGTLCGWSPDLEPLPVPESAPMHTHSNSGAEQYDPCTRYFLGETMETGSSSLHEYTALSASGTLTGVEALANYDFSFNAHVDSQPSVSLMHNAMPSFQFTALQYNEPMCTTDGQTRTFECQWVTNGALCRVLVVADRRSVIKHLCAHDIKPGEDKARQTCLWESCTKTLNKESLVRHILAVHLKERANCAECGLSFAREDSLKRHLKGGQHRVPSDKSAAKQPVRSHVGPRRPEH